MAAKQKHPIRKLKSRARSTKKAVVSGLYKARRSARALVRKATTGRGSTSRARQPSFKRAGGMLKQFGNELRRLVSSSSISRIAKSVANGRIPATRSRYARKAARSRR